MVLNDHELFDYSGNDDGIALALLNIAIADEGSDADLPRRGQHQQHQRLRGRGHETPTNNREQQQGQQRGRSARELMQEQEQLFHQYDPERTAAHVSHRSGDNRQQWRQEEEGSGTNANTSEATVINTRDRRNTHQQERRQQRQRQQHRMGGDRPSAMPRLRPIRAVSPNPAYRGQPGRRRAQRDHNQRYLNALARRIAHHHADRREHQQQQRPRDVLGFGEDSDTEDSDPRYVRRMGPRPEHRTTAFQRLLASTQCMEAFTSLSYSSQHKLMTEGNNGGKKGKKGKTGQAKALQPFHPRYSRISPHIRSALRDNRQPWAAVADLEATVLYALQTIASPLSAPTTTTTTTAEASLFPVQWQQSKRGKRAFVVREVDAYMRLMLHGVCQYHDLHARTVEMDGTRCVRVACHGVDEAAHPRAQQDDDAEEHVGHGSANVSNSDVQQQQVQHRPEEKMERSVDGSAYLESAAVDGFDTYVMPLTHYLMHEFGGGRRGKPHGGRGSRRSQTPRSRRQPEPQLPVDLLPLA